MEFSTLNESNLHNTIKLYYAYKKDGETEVKLDGHVYDIFTHNNEVIEIQTKNLSKLLPKLMDALEKGHKVTLVHPIPISTKIHLQDESGNKISCRTSPKKGSIYNLFKELTGIYPILLNKNFTLEVMEINMTEFRTRTSEPIQAANNRRRFKKDWIKTGKKLNEILAIRIFKTPEDYLKLLPEELNDNFCAKDLQITLKNKRISSNGYNSAHLILWVYSRMGIIEYTETKNRSRYYKITR